jgi:hypothetical protein
MGHSRAASSLGRHLTGGSLLGLRFYFAGRTTARPKRCNPAYFNWTFERANYAGHAENA